MLHNVGYAPRARISWHGPGRDAQKNRIDRVAASSYKGAWVLLRHSIGQRSPAYQRDWNSATALLGVLQPHHRLSEEDATESLIKRIEQHAQALNWPSNLLLADNAFKGQETLVVHDALTTWVALSKAAGCVWCRSRAPQIGRLQSPVALDSGNASMKGLYWTCTVWFERGIPDAMLSLAATSKGIGALEGRKGEN